MYKMSKLNAAFSTYTSWTAGNLHNKRWEEKEAELKYNLSDEGKKQKLNEQLQLDFSSFTPRNKYFDDNCEHYTNSDGTNYRYNRHDFTWSVCKY
jgi:hypothetical protein